MSMGCILYMRLRNNGECLEKGGAKHLAPLNWANQIPHFFFFFSRQTSGAGEIAKQNNAILLRLCHVSISLSVNVHFL